MVYYRVSLRHTLVKSYMYIYINIYKYIYIYIKTLSVSQKKKNFARKYLGLHYTIYLLKALRLASPSAIAWAF